MNKTLRQIPSAKDPPTGKKACQTHDGTKGHPQKERKQTITHQNNQTQKVPPKFRMQERSLLKSKLKKHVRSQTSPQSLSLTIKRKQNNQMEETNTM